MSDKPNKPHNFWQELKRRKVVRVVVVYAAAAFVILQLVEILAPSLRLPEWTMNLILVILIVGFIIAIILSWIYDIHPEGGIVKTEPAHKVKEEEIPKSSNSWKIASYVSFVVIVGLIIFHVISRSKRSAELALLDKSIAVLPFINDSPDEENKYFINGIMDEILIKLQAIRDFSVLGRTSVEQYRNPAKSIPEIASELGVNYIVEGSGQRYGNTFVLRVQLLEGHTGMHLWGESIKQEIESVNMITGIQSGIAGSIAEELQAVITPEEKLLIEKTPTTNLTAYYFYQRGREKYIQYRLGSDNREDLKRAEEHYHKALDYDSAFAQAYTGLAELYWYKYYWMDYVSEEFLDSMLFLANKALSYDDQLAEAYVLRGNYYERYHKKEQAIHEYDKAVKINPNLWEVPLFKGYLYYRDSDWVKSLDNYHKAASMHRGPFLPELFRRLGGMYSMIGFNEKAKYYLKEALKLDNDSSKYYGSLAAHEETNGNFEKAIELGKKSYATDSTDAYRLLRLGVCHSFFGLYEEYLAYIKKYYKRIQTSNRPDFIGQIRLGHAYWVNGFKEEAEYYFNEGLRINNEMLESNRHYLTDYITLFVLAAGHASLGDKEKAFEYFGLMNQKSSMPKWMIKDLNNDPLFDSIRDEPEFQQIVRDVEAKYKAEHERVRIWLEENDML